MIHHDKENKINSGRPTKKSNQIPIFEHFSAMNDKKFYGCKYNVRIPDSKHIRTYILTYLHKNVPNYSTTWTSDIRGI